MNKPKIALCFSGQLRCHYKLTNHWIQNLIVPLQTTHDVVLFFSVGHDQYFIDTWNIIVDEYQNFGLPVVIQTETDQDFYEILPKAFELIPSGLSNGHNQLIREHYYMDRVIELKREYEFKHNFKFEYVIRTRPDCLPGIFDVNILNTVANKFCISDHDHHSYTNGRFTISSSLVADEIFTIINHYNETIDNLPPIVDRLDFDPKLKYFGGEYFWQTHLTLFKHIEISLIPFNAYLVRDHDVKFDRDTWGHIFLNGEVVAKFNDIIPINIVT